MSRYPHANSASAQRGVVLVLAIFAVVLLAVLTVGIAAAVRVELRASRAALERVQSLFLAEAGIRQARAILLYEDANLDTLRDPWGPLAPRPLDLPTSLGPGFYRVRVHDACGRISLNTADPEALFRLTGDAEVAAAIVNWREDLPGPDDAYYESLPHPYRPRHGPFQTLGELLLVRGVTPDMYFGRDGQPGLADLLTVEAVSANTDPNGQVRFGLNEFRNWGEEAFRKAVIAKFSLVFSEYDANEIGDLIFRGMIDLHEQGTEYTQLAQLYTVAGLSYDRVMKLIDYVTVRPGLFVTGLVNINTAPPEVLAALPGSSARLAAEIEARREEAPFTRIGEVAEFLFAQANGPQVFAGAIDHLNVKSSSFIIEAMGYPSTGRAFRTVRVLARRLGDQVSIVHQCEEDRPLPSLPQQTQARAPRRRGLDLT